MGSSFHIVCYTQYNPFFKNEILDLDVNKNSLIFPMTCFFLISCLMTMSVLFQVFMKNNFRLKKKYTLGIQIRDLKIDLKHVMT